MADRIKVYEEKSKGTPIWAWLLPLLLLIALAAFFLLHRHTEPTVTQTAPAAAAPASAASAYPTLGTVHFETDQATLTPEDQATLDRAADAMKTNPNARLRMEGYTDNVGSDTHNLTLSQQRAIAVATYLKGKGIDGSRLGGQGFGEANPTDTNATSAGKADNRRVELYSQQ